jgi:excisionase family DNA binding protein
MVDHSGVSVPVVDKRYLDVLELASYVGLSRWFIYKMVQRRQIPFIPFGRVVRFDRQQVDLWMNQRMVKAKRDLVGLTHGAI